MERSSSDQEQRIIDHEVLLARAEAALARATVARDERRQRKAALDELLWVREQYVAILRAAATEQEARDLGLTDEVIRDVELGDSMADVWRRLHRASPAGGATPAVWPMDAIG